jgi:hypothetical protein
MDIPIEQWTKSEISSIKPILHSMLNAHSESEYDYTIDLSDKQVETLGRIDEQSMAYEVGAAAQKILDRGT